MENKDLERWIAKAEKYKREHKCEMVTIFHGGIYDNWPVVVFDKCGNSKEVVYRTDSDINE